MLFITYVFPPVGVNLVTDALGPLQVTANQNLRQDVVLLPIVPTPQGTTVTGAGVLGTTGGIPTVQRGTPFVISTTAPTNCVVSYEIFLNGTVIASGPMIESPPGTYSATVTLPAGIHGFGEIKFTKVCGGSTTMWVRP